MTYFDVKLQKKPRVIAIVPARAGSTGVSGKNYRLICGHPLIYWTLRAAMDSMIDKIVVTTNCPNVRACSEQLANDRLLILDRPEHLCGPTASTESAMNHALDEIERRGDVFDIVVLLQPTSPFRKMNLIDDCVESLCRSERHDSALTCSKHTPFFYKWDMENRVAVPIADNKRVPRQQIAEDEMYLHDNGNVYVTRMDTFRRMGRVGQTPMTIICADYESMQIDTEDDFKMIEAIANTMGGFL